MLRSCYVSSDDWRAPLPIHTLESALALRRRRTEEGSILLEGLLPGWDDKHEVYGIVLNLPALHLHYTNGSLNKFFFGSEAIEMCFFWRWRPVNKV